MVYTVFQWPYGGREVFLCFSFTGWTNRTRMTLVEGSSLIFQLICDLPPGCYQYKFWVDGVWRFNDQQLYVQDEYESINNVILVKEIIMEIDNSGNPHNEASSTGGRHHEPEISDIDISRRHLCMYLSSQKIYELIPNSGKVFALDAEVAVKEAFHAMYKQGLAVVPIWDSNRRQISGMLTASDFILILMELHRNRATLTDEQLEVHTISAWKEGKSQQYGEAVRAAQLKFGRPLIWAGPDESLKDVALMILQNKISTVPIIYSTIEESCPLLLHIACLGGILKYICRHFKNHLDCLPILRQPVGSLPLGTWKSEVGEAHAHLLALRPSETLSYALNILIEAQISSIPIVDGKGSLINVYSRSDITSLAKDSLYTRIQLDQTIMSQRTLSSLELPRAIVANGLSSSVSVDECTSIDNSERTDGGAFDGTASHIQNNGRRRPKVQDPGRDLSMQVLEKFSRVTRFARETTSQIFRESHSDSFGTIERRTHNLTPHDYPSNVASNDVEKVTEQIPITKDPLEDYREHNDDTTVHFEVIMSEENLIMAKQEGLLKKFKLTTTISTSNMHLFDPKGVIKKYETPEQSLIVLDTSSD